MPSDSLKHLWDTDTETLKGKRADHKVVVLLPVGSVEPHGPHLPLGTDTFISQAVCERAHDKLAAQGIQSTIGPALPYGVTDYASGFSGAISVPAPALTSFLKEVIAAYLADGFAHVCLVNNHLEPEHDQAITAAAKHHGNKASVACPLKRRWARTLSPEFKAGNCHAGQYETSIILASKPETVRSDVASTLPALDTSLAKGIIEGLTTFQQMGIDRAYTGAPAAATEEEGHQMLDLLSDMVVAEVTETMMADSD